MPNETNDTSFAGFFDGRDLPLDPRSTYCADVDCCPSNLCDSCILLAQSDCDCCDGKAVAVLRPEGLPALVVCAACAAEDAAPFCADCEEPIADGPGYHECATGKGGAL